MYRINLYPAGALRRAEKTKTVGRAALVTGLAAAQIVLLAFLTAIALNLKTRVEQTEKMVATQKQRLQTSQTGNRSVPNQIRMIVERRRDRMLWAPALAEIAALIPDNLILDRLEASVPGGEVSRTGISLNGHLREGRNMDQVIEFTRRLSESAVYRRQFGEATIGAMETAQEIARFRISCPLTVKAQEDSVREEVAG